MDIMEKVEEIVKKLMENKELMEKFQKDPISTLENLLGIDLPNDQMEKLVDGVKAKIGFDKVGDALGAIGGLFGRK